jgi:hypothetical protein
MVPGPERGEGVGGASWGGEGRAEVGRLVRSLGLLGGKGEAAAIGGFDDG